MKHRFSLFHNTRRIRVIAWLFSLSALVAIVTLTACSGATSSEPSLAPAAKPNWSSLNLTGQLIYGSFLDNRTSLVQLNLASGKQTTLFQPPENGWLHGFAVAPDGNQIVLAYAPPTADGGALIGHSGLFVIPAGGSDAPQNILVSDRFDEAYFTPTWSPDGRYLYYAHYARLTTENGILSTYAIERLAYPDGPSEVLVENALWPKLSADGALLSYLAFDPNADTNYLYLAEADGKNAKLALPIETFPIVDAHFFSPDGSMLIFSAASGEQSPSGLTGLDRFLGVKAASAHSLPSEWWRVPVTGGEPEQLTHLMDSGLNGNYAPDGQHIGFIAASGVYVMKPDGSGLTKLSDEAVSGGIAWVP